WSILQTTSWEEYHSCLPIAPSLDIPDSPISHVKPNCTHNAPFGAYNNDIRQGAFGNNGAAKISAITDGTSNTILMGEAWGGAQYKTSSSFGPWGLTGTHTCCHLYTPSNSSSTLSLATLTDPATMYGPRFMI